MIVPSSLFRCVWAIESIALLLMIEPIPLLDDEIDATAGSGWGGNTFYFANIPGIFIQIGVLIAPLSGRVKYSGYPPALAKRLSFEISDNRLVSVCHRLGGLIDGALDVEGEVVDRVDAENPLRHLFSLVVQK
jgi:hypothetical protein